jgi:hypothetical protein
MKFSEALAELREKYGDTAGLSYAVGGSTDIPCAFAHGNNECASAATYQEAIAALAVKLTGPISEAPDEDDGKEMKSFEEYRVTLGNNVDNYDINDVKAAFMAGQLAASKPPVGMYGETPRIRVKDLEICRQVGTNDSSMWIDDTITGEGAEFQDDLFYPFLREFFNIHF